MTAKAPFKGGVAKAIMGVLTGTLYEAIKKNGHRSTRFHDSTLGDVFDGDRAIFAFAGALRLNVFHAA
jgi:hypothetical protein